MNNIIYENGISYQEGYTYFYRLVDPITSEICYVGKAIDPEIRYKQHTGRLWEGQNQLKFKWIMGLHSMGELPIMVVFDRTGDEKKVPSIEMEHIKDYWESGHLLLNRKGVFSKKNWRTQLAWERKVIKSQGLNDRHENPHLYFDLIVGSDLDD